MRCRTSYTALSLHPTAGGGQPPTILGGVVDYHPGAEAMLFQTLEERRLLSQDRGRVWLGERRHPGGVRADATPDRTEPRSGRRDFCGAVRRRFGAGFLTCWLGMQAPCGDLREIGRRGTG